MEFYYFYLIYGFIYKSRYDGLLLLVVKNSFILTGLLVTGSKTATHSYNYNTIVVVLLTESVKLFAALSIYRQT
jgi:hypothetical protein